MTTATLSCTGGEAIDLRHGLGGASGATLVAMMEEGLLCPSTGSTVAGGADSTSGRLADEARRGTFIRTEGDLFEAIHRFLSDGIYLARIEGWAEDLRNEICRDPKLLRAPADELYDEAYAELSELERREL